MIDRFRWRRVRILLLGGLACLAIQAEFPPSVWDGIYTESQAQRGEAAYRRYCASCHGPNLEGTGQAPALTGSDFTADWDLLKIVDLVIGVRVPEDQEIQGLDLSQHGEEGYYWEVSA